MLVKYENSHAQIWGQKKKGSPESEQPPHSYKAIQLDKAAWVTLSRKTLFNPMEIPLGSKD